VLTPHPNNNNNNYSILYKMTEEKVPGSKYVNVLADNNNIIIIIIIIIITQYLKAYTY
jgi:hypothetical protein